MCLSGFLQGEQHYTENWKVPNMQECLKLWLTLVQSTDFLITTLITSVCKTLLYRYPQRKLGLRCSLAYILVVETHCFSLGLPTWNYFQPPTWWYGFGGQCWLERLRYRLDWEWTWQSSQASGGQRRRTCPKKPMSLSWGWILVGHKTKCCWSCSSLLWGCIAQESPLSL